MEIVSPLISYFTEISVAAKKIPWHSLAATALILNRARVDRNRIYVFGNGGSAATASHLACDLSKGTINPEKPKMQVISLVDNTAILSAWANDTNYANIFAAQLTDVVEPGDVVIAISGSGNSANVLEGIRVAKKHGAVTIGLSGFDGGKLAQLVDIPIVIPVHCMEQVEDLHLMVAHALAVCLRNMESQGIAIVQDAEAHAHASDIDGQAVGSKPIMTLIVPTGA